MSRRGFRKSIRRILGSLAVFIISAGICAGILGCVNALQAIDVMRALLLSGFTDAECVLKTLMYWPLLILTGLSVGTARKAGVFQVGAQGQFIMGILLALIGALLLSLPWWACLALAALGGAVWNMRPGMLKNRSWVSAVLSAVMLNYIALYLTQWLWEDVLSSLGENAFLAYSVLPVLTVGNGLSVSLALPITLLLCLVLWAVMRFTVFGFEMNAAGSGQDVAERAGMPVKRNKMIVLILSGAFSGMAGGICLLSGMMDSSLSVISFQMGYTGIPVAMLCFSHPLGTVFTALAAAGVYAGSEAMPDVFPQEAVLILVALTLLGSAVLRLKKKNHE